MLNLFTFTAFALFKSAVKAEFNTLNMIEVINANANMEVFLISSENTSTLEYIKTTFEEKYIPIIHMSLSYVNNYINIYDCNKTEEEIKVFLTQVQWRDVRKSSTTWLLPKTILDLQLMINILKR